MSSSNRTSIVDMTDNNKGRAENGQNDSIRAAQNKKVANFEEAIQASGTGKFHYMLFLSIIPASWASSFDTSNMSMILPSAECDLELSLFHKGVLNAITYIGMVLSAMMWGYLADVRGRKHVLVWGFLADGICNVLAGLSQNFWTLVFFKFLSGFFVSGPYATVMSYCSEFYGEKDRARIPIFVGFAIQFGCTINAVLAWLVIPQDWSIVLGDGAFVYNSWRIYLSLCGVPTLVGVFFLSFFPESPRFLMSQGRNKEALQVFRSIYKINTGQPFENYPIQELYDETLMQVVTETSAGNDKAAKPSFYDGIRQMKPIFHYPHLPRLLLVVTMQFCGMLSLNTLRLWQPQLFTTLNTFDPLEYNMTESSMPTFCEILDFSTQSAAIEAANVTLENMPICENTIVADSVYVDTTIVATSSVVSIFVAGLLVNLLGHKYLLLISYGVGLLCLISINWSVNALLTLILACLFMGMMSTSVNVVIGVTVILFPTSLRTMAVSLEMMMGRVGSVIGNLVFPVLMAYGCLAPLIALSLFVIVSIILSCVMPNTKKVKTEAISS